MDIYSLKSKVTRSGCGLVLFLLRWHTRMAHPWWLFILNLPAAAVTLGIVTRKTKCFSKGFALCARRGPKKYATTWFCGWNPILARSARWGVHWGHEGCWEDNPSAEQSGHFWDNLFPLGCGPLWPWTGGVVRASPQCRKAELSAF